MSCSKAFDDWALLVIVGHDAERAALNAKPGRHRESTVMEVDGSALVHGDAHGFAW